jgi:hypothetical protein
VPSVKNDEFYTQYHDIEKEIMAYLEYDPNTFFWTKLFYYLVMTQNGATFTKFFAQNFERLWT